MEKEKQINGFCGYCYQSFSINNKTPTICKSCKWFTILHDKSELELRNLPLIVGFDPAIVISHRLGDKGQFLQISYPPISDSDLQELTEYQRKAFMQLLEGPRLLSKRQYWTLYHNIYDLDIDELNKKIDRLKKLKKVSIFLKDTKFVKAREENAGNEKI